MPDITRYADEADLGLYAVNEEALRGVEPAQIDAALEAASRVADDFLGSQYSLPLQAIGPSLRMNVARIAAYILFSTVGYNPQAGSDEGLKDRNDEAMSWLKLVRGGLPVAGVIGKVTVSGGGGQSPSARPLIVSSSQRGFSSRGDPNQSRGSGGGFVND